MPKVMALLFIAAVSITAASCRPAVTTAWTTPIPPGPCTSSLSTCSWTAARGGNSSQATEPSIVAGVAPASIVGSAVGFPLNSASSATAPPVPWQGSTPFSGLGGSTFVMAGGNIIGLTTLAEGRAALQAYAADSENFQPAWTSESIGLPNAQTYGLQVQIFPIASRPDIVIVFATALVQPFMGFYNNIFVVVHAVTGVILGFTTYEWPGTFTWLDADEDTIVGLLMPYWRVGLTIDANYSVTVRFNVTSSSTGPSGTGYLSAAHNAFVVGAWTSTTGQPAPMEAYDARTGALLWPSQSTFVTVTVIRSLGLLVSTDPNNHLVAMDMRTSKITWMLQSPNMQVRQICSGETSQGPYIAVATPGYAVWVVNGATGVALGDILTPVAASALVCSTSSMSRTAHIVVILVSPSNSLQHLLAHF